MTPRTLKAARSLANLSQTELAKAANCHTKTIARYEGMTPDKVLFPADAVGESIPKIIEALSSMGITVTAGTVSYLPPASQ